MPGIRNEKTNKVEGANGHRLICIRAQKEVAGIIDRICTRMEENGLPYALRKSISAKAFSSLHRHEQLRLLNKIDERFKEIETMMIAGVNENTFQVEINGLTVEQHIFGIPGIKSMEQTVARHMAGKWYVVYACDQRDQVETAIDNLLQGLTAMRLRNELPANSWHPNLDFHRVHGAITTNTKTGELESTNGLRSEWEITEPTSTTAISGHGTYAHKASTTNSTFRGRSVSVIQSSQTKDSSAAITRTAQTQAIDIQALRREITAAITADIRKGLRQDIEDIVDAKLESTIKQSIGESMEEALKKFFPPAQTNQAPTQPAVSQSQAQMNGNDNYLNETVIMHDHFDLDESHIDMDDEDDYDVKAIPGGKASQPGAL